MSDQKFTVVAAVNSHKVLQQNLLRSPGLAAGSPHELLIKEGYSSASVAYNSGIDDAANDVIVFVHQDIYLPESWFPSLQKTLAWLDANDPNWGVLGCFGSTKVDHGGLGRVYTNGLGYHGRELQVPHPVETLDEILLVLRRSSGLRFDAQLPHFHFYGTDICFIAKAAGKKSYSFQGFLVHNTNQLIELPAEFYAGYRYVKKKWAKHLPIAAACMEVSPFDKQLITRRVRDFADGILGTRRKAKSRVDDPISLLSGATR
jgi:glycosyltransferase involved in cell wall biosynthesis